MWSEAKPRGPAFTGLSRACDRAATSGAADSLRIFLFRAGPCRPRFPFSGGVARCAGQDRATCPNAEWFVARLCLLRIFPPVLAVFCEMAYPTPVSLRDFTRDGEGAETSTANSSLLISEHN